MNTTRIISVDVENLRALNTRQCLEFLDPVGNPCKRIIIAGPGGAGKTTLLEAILFGLGASEQIPLTRHYKTGGNGYPELPGEATVTIKTEAVARPLVRYVANDAHVTVLSRVSTVISDLAHSPDRVSKLEKLNRVWSLTHRDRSGIDLSVDLRSLWVINGDGSLRCPIDVLGTSELQVLNLAFEFLCEDFAGVLLLDDPLCYTREYQTAAWLIFEALVPHAQVILVSNAGRPWDLAFSYERYFLAPPGDPRRSDFSPPSSG